MYLLLRFSNVQHTNFYPLLEISLIILYSENFFNNFLYLFCD
jgi:hypothetical protein